MNSTANILIHPFIFYNHILHSGLQRPAGAVDGHFYV